jgi:hypothetical protein
MREIKAVAIFNPQNPLEQAVQDAYYAAAERYLTAGETLGFIEAVVAYDGLYEDFLKHPQAVSKLVFDGEDAEKTLHSLPRPRTPSDSSQAQDRIQLQDCRPTPEGRPPSPQRVPDPTGAR